MKKNKKLILLCVLLSVACVAIFLPSFIQGEYFVGGGDVKTQWYLFYILNKRTTINALKDHTLPFYSFISFLGSNIWASKTSYGLFDIYNVLSYFIKDNYFFIYDLQTYIKILVSGISAYLLINYFYKNNKVALIAGLSYGLSSFAIYFTSQPGFLSFYSLAPLYFLGIEHYLKEKKKILFILMVFLLLLTNYYFFYAISLFSPIYFIYRYYNLNKQLKGVFKSALVLIIYYLIGVLLSSIIIVPAFLYIIQNERVGEFEYQLLFEDLSVYYHLFISMFVPSQTYIYGNNIFEVGEHTLKEICLYSGALISILVPQFLSDKDVEYKKSTTLLYVLLVIVSFSPIVGSIINGFSGPCFRWFYIFIIINIITASKYLDGDINKKNLKITAFVEVGVVFVFYVFCLIYKKYAPLDYLKQEIIIIISMLFIIINTVLIISTKEVFVTVTFVELSLFALMFGYKSLATSISKDEIENVTSVLADNDSYYNLNDYLNSLEAENPNEYYRVYISGDDLYWNFSHNMNIIYNLNGLMTYDSTYAQSFNKMRDFNREQIIDGIFWQFNITDSNLMNFLSTKYSITVSEKKIPFKNYEIIDDNYRGSLIVAKNLDYKPFGRTYNNSMTYEQFKNEYHNDTSLLNDYVISNTKVDVGDLIYSMENVSYYDNRLFGTIETDEDSFVVLSLPYDNGWKIKVNGEQVNYIECNGGVIGFNVLEGNNNIEMYFTPKGFFLGAALSFVGFIIFCAIVLVDVKRKRDEKIY